MTSAFGARSKNPGLPPVVAVLLLVLGWALASGCTEGESEEMAIAETGTGGHSEVEPGFVIDPRRQQLIGVTYGRVERRDVEKVIRTVGTVEYDESRLADVSLKFSGWIEALRVDETGYLVREGQVLLELYSPDLVSTQQEYMTAFDHALRLEGSGDKEAIAASRRLLEATEQRLRYWDIDERHIRELETDRRVSRTLPIHSPAAGYVIDKTVVAGSHMSAGQLLYRLADLDVVWVLADIYEYELPLISVGQTAEVTLAYLAGETIQGRVTYIYPYLEATERTVKIRIELDNVGHRLKKGMYADVELSSERLDVKVIPRTAVLDSGARQVVFIALEEGRFVPRVVRLGARFTDTWEVLEGLEEGESIVTSANFILDSESQLAAGMQQMRH